VTDRIEICGLAEFGRHGWFDFETEQGQRFIVDLVLELTPPGIRPAAASDDLADTVDYGTLADQVRAVVGGEPVRLIETLAERIAAVCLSDPRVAAAQVAVHKPQAPVSGEFADIVVRIRRDRP
jgi:dihydroneopterin aldolase